MMVCSQGPRIEISRPGSPAMRSTLDVFLVELEQAEEVDEVRLHEAQSAQVGEFLVAEAQLAQVGDAGADLVGVRREVDALGAALEHVLDLRARESGAARPASS